MTHEIYLDLLTIIIQMYLHVINNVSKANNSKVGTLLHITFVRLHCEEKTFVGGDICVDPVTRKKEQHLKLQVRQYNLILRGLGQGFRAVFLFVEKFKITVLSGFGEEDIGPLSSIRQDF